MLFYLQSRYYNPQWGRFLNADLPEIAQQSKGEINGLNLFAYCTNDPVNNCDPTGYLSKPDAAIALVSFILFFVDPVLLNDKSNKFVFKVSKIFIDQFGLCTAVVSYKKKGIHLKRHFQVVFGGKKDWKYMTDINNNLNMSVIYGFADLIAKANNKVAYQKSPQDAVASNSYSFFMGAYLLKCHIKTKEIKKHYNELWGKNGIYYKLNKLVVMYRIIKKKKLNGWYHMVF